MLGCDAVCRGGVQEGTMLLVQLSEGFQSFLPPTSILGSSGADSQVGGFVYILGPCGSLQQTLLWSWEFLQLPQLSQVFSVRGFESFFPCAGTLSCAVCHTPLLFLPVYLQANVGLPAPSVAASPGPPATTLSCPVLKQPPWHKSSPLSCPSPPLLQVWMNVSS